MDKRVRDNDSWSSAVADSLRGAEMQVPNYLWDSIESTLSEDVVAPNSLSRRSLWRWVTSGVAAAVVMLFFVWYNQNEIADVITPMEDIEDFISDSGVVKPMGGAGSVAIVEEAELYVDVPCVIEDVVATSDSPLEPNVVSVSDSEVEPQQAGYKSEPREVRREEVVKAGRDYGRYSEPREFIAKESDRETMLALHYTSGGASQVDNVASMTRQMVIYDALSKSSGGYATLSFDDLYSSSKISHHQPMGVGLRVQRELASKFRVATGLNYTRLVSDIDMGGNESTVKQQIHLLGVPLQLNYILASSRDLHIYIGIGGDVEYCVGARVGDMRIEERLWHYSVGATMGVEYDLSSWLALYVEPDVSYHLTETKLQSIRNDSPLSLTFRLGLSFRL